MDDLARLVDEPVETLEVELKSWLDLSDKSHRASLAKELIALANHGGGVVMLGMDGKTLASLDRPEGYSVSVDTVNSIVEKFADPAFHCGVKEVKGHTFIIVPGGHNVPVRSKRDGPAGEIKQYAYYVRRAGPNSQEPQSGLEWDKLIRRCIDNREAELESIVTRVLNALKLEPDQPTPTAADRIRDLL